MGDAFIFTTDYGPDTITGFAAAGAGHDLLQFDASAFGPTLTAANPSAALAALLAATTQNTSGSAVITDLYGDALTLAGVSKATLALMANVGDFRFA